MFWGRGCQEILNLSTGTGTTRKHKKLHMLLAIKRIKHTHVCMCVPVCVRRLLALIALITVRVGVGG